MGFNESKVEWLDRRWMDDKQADVDVDRRGRLVKFQLSQAAAARRVNHGRGAASGWPRCLGALVPGSSRQA
jgi:hypothetical protein